MRQGAGVGDEVTEFPLLDPLPLMYVDGGVFFSQSLTDMYK